MATTEQIIEWMEQGAAEGFAESPIGDLSAGMDWTVYYGWQVEATDELDETGYWAVITDYLGSRALETFDTREEMEAHQEEMLAKESVFYLGDEDDEDEPEFIYDDAE